MKRAIMGALACLTVSTGSARADGSFCDINVKASELLYCDQSYLNTNLQKFEACSAYVNATASALIRAGAICAVGLSGRQAAQATLNWVNANPHLWNTVDAGFAVERALTYFFPCSAPVKPGNKL